MKEYLVALRGADGTAHSSMGQMFVVLTDSADMAIEAAKDHPNVVVGPVVLGTMDLNQSSGLKDLKPNVPVLWLRQ
jgi:hypothetical protein